MSTQFRLPPVSVVDGLLLLAALLGLFVLFSQLWQSQGTAAELQVWVNNKQQQTLSLSQDQQVSVAGQLGESLIQIQAGKARFLRSPCRNQVCVHSGWASHKSDLLACLPNGIALVFEGRGAVAQEPQHRDVDAVNF